MKKAKAPTNASPAPVVSTTFASSAGINFGVGFLRVAKTDPCFPIVIITKIDQNQYVKNQGICAIIVPVGHFSSRAEATSPISSRLWIETVLRKHFA